MSSYISSQAGGIPDLVVCDEFQVEHGRPTSIAPSGVQFCMVQTCQPPCRSQIKGATSNIYQYLGLSHETF